MSTLWPRIPPTVVRRLAHEIGCEPTTYHADDIAQRAISEGMELIDKCVCGQTPNPSESLHVDADGWLHYICDDCYDADTNLPKMDPHTVESALRHINRSRAPIGEPALDPVASGWRDDDIVLEARRLGWVP